MPSSVWVWGPSTHQGLLREVLLGERVSKPRPELSRGNLGGGVTPGRRNVEVRVLTVQRLLPPWAPSLPPHGDFQEYSLLRFPAVNLMELCVSELHLKYQISAKEFEYISHHYNSVVYFCSRNTCYVGAQDTGPSHQSA